MAKRKEYFRTLGKMMPSDVNFSHGPTEASSFLCKSPVRMKRLCGVFLLAVIFEITTAGAAVAQTGSEPKKAPPNVLIIVADDIGYMDFGSYGGEATTPAIDAIAERGIKMSRFYTSPQCGPSRAMLLTGADNHEVGIAMIAETLPETLRDNPAYSMRFPKGTLTLADRLGAAGYQTYAVGKWGIGDIGKNLPRKHGFDRSLVLDSTGADNWKSRVYLPFYDKVEWFEDDKAVDRPGNEYSSKLFVDRMIDYIDGGTDDQPFFGYLAFQAVHIPVQAPRSFIDNYNGRYDQGWHVLRQERLAKAKELGLVSADTQLPPQPKEARQWDALSDAQKAFQARAMQVNAGMIEAMDHHLKRLFAFLEKKGQLDNTIIIIVSDNGPESAVLNGQNFLMDYWLKAQGYHTEIETLGEQDSMAAIGMEWATVGAVPFSRYKFHATEGGHRVPMIIAGPRIQAKGFVAARSHVFDIVPTVLELAGLSPISDPNESVPIRGRSLAPLLTGDRDEIYGEDKAVGMEVAANAALYKGDWKLQKIPAPSGDGKWRLYNLASDPGEMRDLQHDFPGIFKQLKSDYAAYSEEVGVSELDDDFSPGKLIALKAAKPLMMPFLSYGFGAIFVFIMAVWLGVRRLRRTS